LALLDDPDPPNLNGRAQLTTWCYINITTLAAEQSQNGGQRGNRKGNQMDNQILDWVDLAIVEVAAVVTVLFVLLRLHRDIAAIGLITRSRGTRNTSNLTTLSPRCPPTTTIEPAWRGFARA
jgi:hypothetical protein